MSLIDKQVQKWTFSDNIGKFLLEKCQNLQGFSINYLSLDCLIPFKDKPFHSVLPSMLCTQVPTSFDTKLMTGPPDPLSRFVVLFCFL